MGLKSITSTGALANRLFLAMAGRCQRMLSKIRCSEDLKKIDVPILILHGMTINRAHRRLGQTVSEDCSDATLKVYPGAPHGMCSTHKDQVNADLLAFIKGKQAAVA